MRYLLAIVAIVCFAATAAAQQGRPSEEVRSDISERKIAIESNFTGARIVIFGTVENTRQTEFEPGLYDVVVVVRGPVETAVTRRKSRVAGIWINTDSRSFANVPRFYAVLSKRPLAEISTPETLSALGIGYDGLDIRPLDKNGKAEAFREALIRLKQNQGLYSADEEGVVFVSRNLFRATIDLPADVPVGIYSTDVYLFFQGELLSRNRSTLAIEKVGFERAVYAAAFDYPLLYGIAAVIVAVVAGLLASALFRRE